MNHTHTRLMQLLVLSFTLVQGCASTHHRYTKTILDIHSLYSGSIIRVDSINSEGHSGGTGFYTGPHTGFATAKHVLMTEQPEGPRQYTDSIMLHIPSAKTTYTSHAGSAFEQEADYFKNALEDWANFLPHKDAMTRRPLVYDPHIPLHNNQHVYIAGYPYIGRTYLGTPTLEYFSTRSFVVCHGTYKFRTLEQSDNTKYHTIKVAGFDESDDFMGMSGAPALIWDKSRQDFIAVGIIVSGGEIGGFNDTRFVMIIRPDLPIFPAKERQDHHDSSHADQ